MSKLPKKSIPVSDLPGTELLSSGSETLLKWAPLVCAGVALGIGVLALTEIRSMKEELMGVRKEKTDLTDITKKFDDLDVQMKRMNEYLTKKDKNPVVKSVVKPEIPKEPNVINEQYEYEEVEVTDDEEEN